MGMSVKMLQSGRLCRIVMDRKLYGRARWNDSIVRFSFVVCSVIFGVALLPATGETKNILRSPRSLTYTYKSPEPFIIDSRMGDSSFRVFWNIPTFQCRSHGIYFTDVSNKYGISQNEGDSFRGNKITIMYDPGNFPALLENGSQPGYYYRNGGIPQEGDLQVHLKAFKESLESQIPDEKYNGLAVIDFESWRPVFRQNFGKLTPYKDISYDKERKRHPMWPKSWIEKEASKRFEEAGKKFVEQTIALAKELRPLASWGYYAYPYCFNMNSSTKKPNCPDEVVDENNRVQWLWNGVDIFLPSVYMGKNQLNSAERLQLVKGRVAEALRIQGRTSGDRPIYPYLWYKYSDETTEFLTKDDLYTSIKYMKDSGLAGVILWGSTNDVNTKEKCHVLQDYIQNVLGPVAREFVQLGRHRSGSFETESDNAIKERNSFATNSREARKEEEVGSFVEEKTKDGIEIKTAFTNFGEDDIARTSHSDEYSNKQASNIEVIKEVINAGGTVDDVEIFDAPKEAEVEGIEGNQDVPNAEDIILVLPEEEVNEDEYDDTEEGGEEIVDENGDVSLMKIKTQIFKIVGRIPYVLMYPKP